MDLMAIDWALCCFCGADITPSSVDPLQLEVTTAAEKSQYWFSHADCFKNALCDKPEISRIFTPAYF
jgi:hypothetical protein